MSALPFALRLTCCCYCWLTCLVILIRPSCYAIEGFLEQEKKSNVARQRGDGITTSDRVQRTVINLGNHGFYNDETDLDLSYDEDEDEDDDPSEANTTEKGRLLGSPCDNTCSPDLQHVICDSATGLCDCEKLYPVRLGPTKGCAKPKKLGEQCFYRATCTFTDQHATCTQVHHNAVCDCKEGYHRVSISRPNKRDFCAEDLVIITSDLPTLFGVASGIAVLGGLICFVLRLFNPVRYTRPGHYVSASDGPPMIFSSDTGIPLTLSGRPSSRTSQRSDPGTINCSAFARRPSSGGSSRGPLVPASRAGAARAAAILLISCHLQAGANDGNKHRRTLSDVAEGSSNGLGSRRPSLASIHSSVSSARSYSARRLERERNEKEQRLALQELRIAKQREHEVQQDIQQTAPTPSPKTPHSTDELLPSVEESKEVFYNEIAVKNSTNEETSCASTSSTLPQKALVSVVKTTALTTSALVSASLTKRMSGDTETAFNATTVYTPAFNKETAGNCSNEVDIFES